MMTAPAIATHRPLGYGLAALIVFADQLVKWALTGPARLAEISVIEVLPVFDFRYIRNYGISLGLFQAGSDTARWALVALTTVIATGVAAWIWRERLKGEVVALALVLGGAIGNISDRARLGYVIDYADLHIGAFRPFLVFNVADAAITIGVVVLLGRAFLVRQASKVETTNA